MPERMLKLFAFAHLQRDDLRSLSQRFSDSAHDLVAAVPPGPERTVALRKLLEAKVAAVRAGRDSGMTKPLDPELQKLRGLSPGELADEAGALKAALGRGAGYRRHARRSRRVPPRPRPKSRTRRSGATCAAPKATLIAWP